MDRRLGALRQAGVPEGARIVQTKPQIALAEIDRLIAAGMPFGCVLADAGYGSGAPFRQGFSARGLSCAVGVPRTLKVFTTDVGLLFPQANRGKTRLHPVPSEIAQDAAHVLTACPWRRVTWRQGTKGPLAARFSAVRVRLVDGPRSPRHGHLPGEEVWLVGEWRNSGERKYYLSNLPAQIPMRRLAAAIKAPWVCEQGHQQLKQELRQSCSSSTLVGSRQDASTMSRFVSCPSLSGVLLIPAPASTSAA